MNNNISTEISLASNTGTQIEVSSSPNVTTTGGDSAIVVVSVENDTSTDDPNTDSTNDGTDNTDSGTITDSTNINKPFRGNFDLLITELNYREDEEGNPGSIEDMKLYMYNKWADFNVRVKVYWYVASDDEVFKNKIRYDKILGKVSVDKKYTFNLRRDEFTGTFFIHDGAETIKVELYNEDTGVKMTTIEKKLSDI